MYDSVHDLMRALDLLVLREDVDASRVGTTGISLGGMHSWFFAAADPRVTAAAPMIGVQGYRYALEHELWGSRVDTIRPVFETAARELGASTVDTAGKRAAAGTGRVCFFAFVRHCSRNLSMLSHGLISTRTETGRAALMVTLGNKACVTGVESCGPDHWSIRR